MPGKDRLPRNPDDNAEVDCTENPEASECQVGLCLICRLNYTIEEHTLGVDLHLEPAFYSNWYDIGLWHPVIVLIIS